MSGFAKLPAVAAFLASAAVFAVTPRPLADVPISTPAGKAINLKQYRGKVVLMAIISSECAPCIKSIDILNRAQNDFGPQGFQVVAAVGDPNAQYTLASFVQRYRPVFPVGYLNTDQMIKIGDIGKDDRPFAPIFLFIDRKGIVRQQFTGDQPFFKAEEPATRKLIQDLLKP
jgi:thiol-disulfide isomerase/thioredoxin